MKEKLRVGIVELFNKKRFKQQQIEKFVSNILSCPPLDRILVPAYIENIHNANKFVYLPNKYPTSEENSLFAKINKIKEITDFLLIVAKDVVFSEEKEVPFPHRLNGRAYSNEGIAFTISKTKTAIHELGHLLGLEHYYVRCPAYYSEFVLCKDVCDYYNYMMCPEGNGSKGFHPEDIEKLVNKIVNKI